MRTYQAIAMVLLGTLAHVTASMANEFVAAKYASAFPVAEPKDVHFSAEGLRRIETFFKDEIDRHRVPGGVVGIVSHGKLIYLKSFGVRDPQLTDPMPIDAIFGAASMTKPMVAVGALQLTQQGKLPLQSPVGQYIPEVSTMNVEVIGADGTVGAEAQKNAMTVHDLFRHTSGLTYGGRKDTLGKASSQYPTGDDLVTMSGKDEFIQKVTALPLVHQPGTTFEYSESFEMLGSVIEKVTQRGLGTYLREGVWKPLGMNDTGFSVPQEKRGRLAKPFSNDPLTGKPQKVLTVEKNPTFECGGGCSLTTVPDYLKFGQMLANKGNFKNTQILSPAFVKLMLSNHLTASIQNNVAKVEPHRDGYGFGLGVAVRLSDGLASIPGDAGEITWNGAYGTGFVLDPKQELVLVFGTAAPGDLRKYYREQIQDLVYGAMTSN